MTMPHAVTRPALLGALALLATLAACGDQKVASASPAGAAPPAELTLPDPLATVGGEKITMVSFSSAWARASTLAPKTNAAPAARAAHPLR